MVKWWKVRQSDMKMRWRMKSVKQVIHGGNVKCRVLYMVEGEMFWYILEIESAAATNSKE